jgi:hypothetical protein
MIGRTPAAFLFRRDGASFLTERGDERDRRPRMNGYATDPNGHDISGSRTSRFSRKVGERRDQFPGHHSAQGRLRRAAIAADQKVAWSG